MTAAPQRPGALPSTASYATHQVDETTVLTVVGEVDVSNVSSLRGVLNDLVVEGHVHLVLDLGGVTFMDSSGLGILVGAQRKARAFKGSLVLVLDGGPVAKLLSITALDRVLRHVATLDEALAARA